MKYVIDEATMQEMFSIYHESRPHDFVIELYVEFEHLTYGVEEADGDMDWEGYNSKSEDEFEGNYEIDDLNVDGDDVDCINEPDVKEVVNVLASHPFGELSFIRALDLAALSTPEFPEYVTAVVEGPRMIPNPNLRRVCKGRLKITWFLNEMDMREMRAPRRCMLCGTEGHSLSRCSHRGGSSARGNVSTRDG
ncbi:hypothetical protein Ahy_A07g033504 [Arachis hypogaea]|uniref:CCHC-type domain-containing protein n=1 Tax=Arachis hypogaea TaxID=3818 RepID=A0A445C9Q7_ARAHY|nr:hypothetical protein Ahy_A07g033504 [Arachis hypogaea]